MSGTSWERSPRTAVLKYDGTLEVNEGSKPDAPCVFQREWVKQAALAPGLVGALITDGHVWLKGGDLSGKTWTDELHDLGQHP